MSCQWTLLPSLDDKRKRVCGDPVESNSGYCPVHHKEMLNFMASNVGSRHVAVEREPKLKAAGVIPITALQKRELSGAQFEANVALDDIYAAVQRIRDLVNRADTRHKTAWDKSLWSRENELRRATSRLRDATKTITNLLPSCPPSFPLRITTPGTAWIIEITVAVAYFLWIAL